jgi:hypothetical protein
MERRHFQGTPLPVPLPACAGRGDSIRHLSAKTLPKTDLRPSQNSKPDDDMSTNSGFRNVFNRRTGLFGSVLDFVLVSSKNLGTLEHVWNGLKSDRNLIKSVVLCVCQAMARKEQQ